MPQADIALAVLGRIVVLQPARAIGQDIEPRRAAAGDDHALARIDALAHGDLVDRLDHQLVGDGDDGEGGVRHGTAKLLREPFEHAMRSRRIKPHAAAVEIVRSTTEHDARRR